MTTGNKEDSNAESKALDIGSAQGRDRGERAGSLPQLMTGRHPACTRILTLAWDGPFSGGQ